MAEHWQIDEPKVIDVGTQDEVVTALSVALVGGHVDIVTHEDSPTARLEVHEVSGRPLEVTWNGTKLKITHVQDKDGNIWEALKSFSNSETRLSARISISVPTSARVSVGTVSAQALVNGVRAAVRGNTVTGSLTLDDIVGDVRANTVSGEIECHALAGDLSANTVSGAITVSASTLAGIKLNTLSGGITVDLLNGAATIGSNSVSGDVTVRVPSGHGYDVTAHTASGDIVIDGISMRGERGQRGGQLRDGDGALAIKANSVSGNVVVLRSSSGVQDSRPADIQDSRPADIQGARPADVKDSPAAGGRDTAPSDIQDVI